MAYCIAKSIEIQRSKALKEFFLKAEASRKWRDASEETEVLYIDGLKDGEKLTIIQILGIIYYRNYQGTIITAENPEKGQAPNKSGAATGNVSQDSQNINSKTIILLRNYYGVIVKTMQNSFKDQLLQNYIAYQQLQL